MSNKKRSGLWDLAIKRMRRQWRIDRRNQLMQADPWSRAAHCMMQAWRIRQSQPPRKAQAPGKPPATWEEFARRAAQESAQIVRRPMPGTWLAWARNRSLRLIRYLRKRDRQPPQKGLGE